MKSKLSWNQKELGDAGITVTVVCALIGIAVGIATRLQKILQLSQRRRNQFPKRIRKNGILAK